MYIMNYNKDSLLKKMDYINYNNNLNSKIEDISLDGTNINDLHKINFKQTLYYNSLILRC